MTSEPRIGVIGAGVMGAGIAQTAAVSGLSAICCDVSRAALDAARRETAEGRFGIRSAVQRGKLSQASAEAALARLHFTESFEEAAAADGVFGVEDLAVRDPAVGVDGGVHVVVANRVPWLIRGVAATVCPPTATVRDPAQLLYVDVDEFTRP